MPTFKGKSRENYLIEVATEEEVRGIRIDISKLLKCKMHGVIVTAKGLDKYDFVSRFFAPEVGVPEDPVTGLAHYNVPFKKTMILSFIVEPDIHLFYLFAALDKNSRRKCIYD
ncbi:MAG: PhzF family phenazine biosynthesis protein [Desulfosporosinus sp.]|nr:PhzF family phenazine biosynthesis protein [Desulfosporosinus sp.]